MTIVTAVTTNEDIFVVEIQYQGQIFIDDILSTCLMYVTDALHL